MARIEEIERRLLNWARCRLSGGGVLGFASVALGRDPAGGRDMSRESRIPMNDCEADETEAAIKSLAPELRDTVKQFYLQPGGEAEHMRKLGCSRATLHARIGRAHRAIDAWLAERTRQHEENRRRVEQAAGLIPEERPGRGGSWLGR